MGMARRKDGRRIGDHGRRPFPTVTGSWLQAIRAGALAAVISLAACRGGEPEGMWVRADMIELPEGVPARELPDPESPGAGLAGRYCSQCHGIPTPKRHSAEDWMPTLRRMFARMDHMSRMGGMDGMMGRGMRGRVRMPMGMHGVRSPTVEEQRLIVAYYQTHALRTIEPAALPTGQGAALFSDWCSRCHALPDPEQHTPEEWPAVVARMRENTERMDVGAFSNDEAAAIIEYLRRASGGE
jgi:cytochrome c5